MKLLFLLFIALLTGFAHAQLSNESEAGIASANGNTRTQTYNLKQLNDYKLGMNVASFKARYLNASSNGVETARFLMGGLRVERKLSNELGIFFGEGYEQDKFAGIDKRVISDTGGKYRFIDSETAKLFAELGYRYMHEERLDDSRAFSQYGRAYSEWEMKWNQNFSSNYWVEYLPNISDNNDWQLNTELSVSAMANSIFSLKSSVLIRYDHLPAPGILYETDTLFTTALVAKF